MKRTVKIPKVGNVAFPDHMSDDEVNKASADLHDKANPQPDQAAAPPPDITPIMAVLVKGIGGSVSEQHKTLATIAKTLEDNPTLAQLAIDGLTARSLPSTSGAAEQQTQQPQTAQPPGASA